MYSASIDIWAAGCVFAEMLRGVPLFPVKIYDMLEILVEYNQRMFVQGNTDIEQLALVIRTLGTPSATWPEVKNLPDYNKIR